jgi:hypothetical protein
MALSMDEQRVLAEMERRLSADDPGLAACLTTFRRPGPATVLRSPRARIIGSLFTVLLVAMVSLMVYAMIPFSRGHGARQLQPTTATGTVSISAPGISAKPASAGAGSGVRATATARTTNRAPASGKALAAKGKATTTPAVSPAGP